MSTEEMLGSLIGAAVGGMLGFLIWWFATLVVDYLQHRSRK